jgi:hypothetical protein
MSLAPAPDNTRRARAVVPCGVSKDPDREVPAMQQPRVEQDARRERRVLARLQIELVMDDSVTSEQSSTINISANGVYFNSRRYLEPLTMLGLRLFLPGQDEHGEPEALDVRGVVVRVEPETPCDNVDRYEIACYFTETTPEFRERLGRYVQSNL